MSQNYAREIPRDKSGNALQLSPSPYVAYEQYTSENASVSSVVTLTDSTTVLEVAAIGTAAVLRFVPSTDTQASVISAAGTANYDVIIPPNTVRKVVLPIERIGTSSIVGAGVQAGTYRRVAWKSTGIGSIMATEY